MNRIDGQDLHSEPVQEIMGTIPSWIIRWGVAVIASVFALIVIGCCVIKYPKTVDSNISIISTAPPSPLDARRTGIIDTIVVKNGQAVKQGDLIALLRSPALYEDIRKVHSFVDEAGTDALSKYADLSTFDSQLSLGSIQNKWAELRILIKEYQLYRKLNQVEKKRLRLEQGLNELKIQKRTEEEVFNLRFSLILSELQAQITSWLEMNAFIAPIDGTVSLHSAWKAGQYVKVGDVIASVAPDVEAVVGGRMNVPSVAISQIKNGQTVNVRLNGFPYIEYGILKGVVSRIAEVPERMPDGSVGYNVDVSFPQGLVSTYHNTYPFVQDMEGEAEIITRDQRLIEQFLQPIISLFHNR